MKRAQESSPIEVLIGVTILAFVLIIATGIFQSSCNDQYKQKLNAGFSKLARDLESVYIGDVGTKMTCQVDFSVPNNCMGVRLKNIVIVKAPKSICKRHLAKKNCMMLIATLRTEHPSAASSGNPEFLTLEVIDIPSTVALRYNNSKGCDGLGSPLGDYADINNVPKNCTIDPTYYNFKIEKTKQDEIVIS